MTDFAEQAAADLHRVREVNPLVHSIMNTVTVQFVANALLALGASPVMAHAEAEVEDVVAGADAFVLNLGTLRTSWIPAMRKAGRRAAAAGIPRVLDPVGAGFSAYRTGCARDLMADIRPTVIRGNPSEILALSGSAEGARGVDGVHRVVQAAAAARRLARDFDAVVVVSGPDDLVTDGHRELRVRNGHPLLKRVTGSGCAASAAAGAFLAAAATPLQAAAAAMACFNLAGELAGVKAAGPGSFAVELIDALYALTPERFLDGAKIEAI